MIGYMIVIALVIVAMVSVFVALSVESTEDDQVSLLDTSERDETSLDPW